MASSSKLFMRNYTIPLLTVAMLLTVASKVSSQIISPQEVISLNNMKQPAVSNLLQVKGFEFNMSNYDIENQKEDLWIFRPIENSTEFAGGFVKKITDSSGKSRMALVLYNLNLYNDFINNLLKSNFRFKGMKTIEHENPIKGKIDYNNYLHFAKKQLSFMCREAVGSDQSKFYEITLQ